MNYLKLIVATLFINIFVFFWITYKFDIVEEFFKDGKTTSDEMSPLMFALTFYAFDFVVSKLVPLGSIILIVRVIISSVIQKRKSKEKIEYLNKKSL